jgi:hypothetical protein
MVSFVIPNVFADTPSDSYDAVAINAVSPVAPMIRTTFPFVMLCPVVFFTYINMSAAFCAETANDDDNTLFDPNGPNTFEPVTNDAVYAVDANDAELINPVKLPWNEPLNEPDADNPVEPVVATIVPVPFIAVVLKFDVHPPITTFTDVKLSTDNAVKLALLPDTMTFFHVGI